MYNHCVSVSVPSKHLRKVRVRVSRCEDSALLLNSELLVGILLTGYSLKKTSKYPPCKCLHNVYVVHFIRLAANVSTRHVFREDQFGPFFLIDTSGSQF